MSLSTRYHPGRVERRGDSTYECMNPDPTQMEVALQRQMAASEEQLDRVDRLVIRWAIGFAIVAVILAKVWP